MPAGPRWMEQGSVGLRPSSSLRFFLSQEWPSAGSEGARGMKTGEEPGQLESGYLTWPQPRLQAKATDLWPQEQTHGLLWLPSHPFPSQAANQAWGPVRQGCYGVGIRQGEGKDRKTG